MERIVAVGLGEVLYDHDLETDRYTFGGAPANFADHFLKCTRLAAAAAEVFVVSAIGTDASGAPDERGRSVLASLTARGLGHALTRVPGMPTGVVDKRKDAAGVNRYEIRPGAWDAIAWSEELALLARRCDVVCFGSLAQRSAVSAATIRRFLDEMIASGRDSWRVFDVNIRQSYYSREVVEASIERCNILKISDEELDRVVGALPCVPAGGDAADVCRSLLARYGALRLVILTEGDKGSRIFTRDGVCVYRIPEELRVPPVDTVGAGDSFTAAFCAVLATGLGPEQAQVFASRVAAFVCSRESATPEYPDDAWAAFGGR